MYLLSLTLPALVVISCATGASAQTYTTTFEDGFDGWQGSNGTFMATDLGTGNRHLRTVDETFGVWYRTNQNDAFLGDYTGHDSVTLSMDIRVDLLNSQNLPDGLVPYTRPLTLELRNYDYNDGFFNYASVYFVISREINEQNQDDWTTFSVSFDPTSTTLPDGWGGYGGSDDADGPVLPDGVTFADILANVDEVVWSTFDPEEFYLFAFFDVLVDNFTITRGAACPADLNGDGLLDFFDLSAFINAFAAMKPDADFNDDGLYDFFDVSGFLNQFAA
ncbi:MAG: GC-type dockerin domain-anchored protein, partial [Phycisphaerales bacterium]